MNAEIFKRKWQQLRDEVKQWWEKLTADDLDSIKGERDTLVGLVQERYGYGREHAEAEVDRCLNAYDRVLLITGERRSERSYGMFRRQIPLPEGVNAEQATASFKDGVLEIAIPAP
jgi:uncharacterized protein YjbJ (UPF0337 family)